MLNYSYLFLPPFGSVNKIITLSFAIKKAELQLLDISTIKGENFDWGFNGKIGVEFSQIQLFCGYELGMKEVWIWPENAKNRSIVFGVGYIF